MGEGSLEAWAPCVRLGGWGKQSGAGPNGCSVWHPGSCSVHPVLLDGSYPDALICSPPTPMAADPLVLAENGEIICGGVLTHTPESPDLFFGAFLFPHTHHDLQGEAGLAPCPPLLIRGGQEIAWVLDDKSIGCLAGGQCAQCCLMDCFLLAPAQGAAPSRAGLQQG